MRGFDTFVVVDWSGAAKPSPAKPSADAIWVAIARRGGETVCNYHRTRADAFDALGDLFEAELKAGRRVLAGFDFPFGYPKGFARALTGTDDPLAFWGHLAGLIKDAPDNANNRFDVAEALNRRFPGIGPFWGCPPARATADLPAKGTARAGHGLPERRAVEATLRRAQPCWKLFTTGSVGSQALLGIPRVESLRRRFGSGISVSPFELPQTPIVLAEVFPSLIDRTIADLAAPDEIKDRAQVRVLASALASLDPDLLGAMLREGHPEEGHILGLGHEAALDAAARAPHPAPPPLRDDCFALPAGVDWMPVDEALGRLRDRLSPVTASWVLPAGECDGRILAEDVAARRANPPAANSAVDGYGFAHAATGEGPQVLPLAGNRAAAGAPFAGAVPEGRALRILTGALVPPGVDTVILEEDVRSDGRAIAFRGPVKRGANTRRAGEDVEAGAPVLPAGHVLRPPDLALLAATGIAEVPVRARLRVGILSTGSELAAPGDTDDPARTYDANRPMLLSLLRRWGHAAVDLGMLRDDRDAIAARLGAPGLDAVLATGGASAGDEDHVSALLRDAGNLTAWRVALKPGRPLALGQWEGRPIFGLPGNPVAALVCALIFARPALSMLAGAGWTKPASFDVPAAFEKRKKPGRREYLRARLTAEGTAEVFASEGSGRISGLTWADGLVELEDGARTIRVGDSVRFVPYAAFGI